jgi:hypothetical protein
MVFVRGPEICNPNFPSSAHLFPSELKPAYYRLPTHLHIYHRTHHIRVQYSSPLAMVQRRSTISNMGRNWDIFRTTKLPFAHVHCRVCQGYLDSRKSICLYCRILLAVCGADHIFRSCEEFPRGELEIKWPRKILVAPSLVHRTKRRSTAPSDGETASLKREDVDVRCELAHNCPLCNISGTALLKAASW